MVRYIEAFWHYPKLVLAIMTFINLVMFFDRGAIASVLPKLQINWNLSDTMQGIIQSAFVVGFMTASPVWANLANKFHVNNLITVGLTIFSLSALILGIIGVTAQGEENIWGYYLFVTFRVILGIGEAAFVPLSVSIIDDISPNDYKSIYMSVFLVTGPVGIAAGYGVSGLVETLIGYWQIIFFGEATFVILLAVFMIFVPLHGHRERNANISVQEPTVVVESAFADDEEESEIKDNTSQNEIQSTSDVDDLERPNIDQISNATEQKNVITVLKPLAKNVIYVSIVATSTQYFGVLGALVFWTPTYMLKRLEAFDYSEDLRITLANLGFSIIIIITSIFGTGLGGIILDKTGGVIGWRGVARALFFCMGYLAAAIPFGLCVFLIESMSAVLLFALLGIGVFFLMMMTSPFQCALVACLPTELRHFGMSYQIFFLHLLGDFPSPFLFGVVADASSMKWAMVGLWSMLFLGILFMTPGALWALRKHKIEQNMGHRL
jgi:MFS family permease